MLDMAACFTLVLYSHLFWKLVLRSAKDWWLRLPFFLKKKKTIMIVYLVYYQYKCVLA